MPFRSRDPIHDFVVLPDEFAAIVDTSVVQRLRGIRQLALASLVYHGAVHTRFEHTLGVAHIAQLMSKQLGIEGDEHRLVLLAALLHDAGHGPFSHVSESSLDRFGDRSKRKPEQSEHKIHEVVTAQIIRSNSELNRLIKEPIREQVIQLLGNWNGRPVLKQIVSGPLDADKQDYLRRDSYFCGVQYGHYDLHQLLRSLTLPDETGDLMIDEDGVHPAEQFVLAKYYMTTMVYRHRVRLITDQMITRAIRLGIEKDQTPEMIKLYSFDGTDAFIDNYVRWDDARFMEMFCPLTRNPPGPKSGAMLRRLRERKLLKEVFRDPIGRFYDARHLELLKGFHKQRADALSAAVERRVAEFLTKQLHLQAAMDPDFVIGHSFGIKSARESSKNEEAGILVNVKPAPQFFTDESTLFRSINEAYSDNFLVVFAPVEWPDPTKKDSLRHSWSEAIRSIIQDECKKVNS